MPSGSSLEAAREAGVITASEEHAAVKPKRSLLARIFGTGKDQDEQSEQPAPKLTSLRARAPMAVASLSPPRLVAVEHIVPLPAARPKPVDVAIALPRPRPAEQTIVTASAANNLFNNRSYWRGAVETGSALPAPITAGTSYETASLDPASTGSTNGDALAYATQPETSLAARVRPMGSRLPRMPEEASVIPTSSNARTAVKRPLAPALGMGGGERSDSPWLRAAMLTPSMSSFMTTTRLGALNPRWQYDLLHKPSQALVMTFSADPHLGMVADRFSGSAAVFRPPPRSTCRRQRRCANPTALVQHPQSVHVGFQHGLLLAALVGVLLAQPYDGAQRLDVVAGAVGFGIDVADIVGGRLLLLLSRSTRSMKAFSWSLAKRVAGSSFWGGG